MVLLALRRVRCDFSRCRVRVLARFDDFTGVYLVHCHNLEHSDAGMARNFEVRA